MYTQPYASGYEMIDQVANLLMHARQRHPNDRIIVEGDFIARLGTENQVCYDSLSCVGKMNSFRSSRDKEVTLRGKQLLELLLLNDRSSSGQNEYYIFSNANCSSVIDPIFVNTNMQGVISEFKVSNLVLSTHFPSNVLVKINFIDNTIAHFNNLFWNNKN